MQKEMRRESKWFTIVNQLEGKKKKIVCKGRNERLIGLTESQNKRKNRELEDMSIENTQTVMQKVKGQKIQKKW